MLIAKTAPVKCTTFSLHTYSTDVKCMRNCLSVKLNLHIQ